MTNESTLGIEDQDGSRRVYAGCCRKYAKSWSIVDSMYNAVGIGRSVEVSRQVEANIALRSPTIAACRIHSISGDLWPFHRAARMRSGAVFEYDQTQCVGLDGY